MSPHCRKFPLQFPYVKQQPIKFAQYVIGMMLPCVIFQLFPFLVFRFAWNKTKILLLWWINWLKLVSYFILTFHFDHQKITEYSFEFKSGHNYWYSHFVTITFYIIAWHISRLYTLRIIIFNYKQGNRRGPQLFSQLILRWKSFVTHFTGCILRCC